MRILDSGGDPDYKSMISVKRHNNLSGVFRDTHVLHSRLKGSKCYRVKGFTPIHRECMKGRVLAFNLKEAADDTYLCMCCVVERFFLIPNGLSGEDTGRNGSQNTNVVGETAQLFLQNIPNCLWHLMMIAKCRGGIQ